VKAFAYFGGVPTRILYDNTKFSVTKSLDSFDFLAMPTLNKAMVLELARSEFLSRRENLLVLGNSDPATFCTSLLHH
jgi:DNA replication protein DnaC